MRLFVGFPIFLCIGLCFCFLGNKLRKEKHPNINEKSLANYYGEFMIGGVFFIMLSFISLGIWLFLHFIYAK